MSTPTDKPTNLVRGNLVQKGIAQNIDFNEKIKKMMKEGRRVTHFGFGQSPFPVPECLVDFAKEFAHVYGYVSMTGIPELRQAIVQMHKQYDEVTLDPEQIVVGPGSKELLFLTMHVFNGDIILPTPAWSTYESQIYLAGKTPIFLETTNASCWKVTPESLRNALKNHKSTTNKMIVLTNPGNPSGMVYTAKELSALAEECRRLGVIVLSDEIYGRLAFDDDHQSMMKFYPEGTILTTGFSKWTSAGGWRIGYAYYPHRLTPILKAVLCGGSQTYSCAPSPLQYAVAKALTTCADELDRYALTCKRILCAIAQHCHRELSSVGVTGHCSQGGYYYIPDFEVCRPGLTRRGITTGKGFSATVLKDIDVALMPMDAFLGAPEDLTTRLCFVCFDGKRALETILAQPPGTEVTEEFLEEFCGPVVQGIAKLKEWVIRHK
ncbi:aspartate aminotransferase-like isoform X2 [Oratosquilla oratoria]